MRIRFIKKYKKPTGKYIEQGRVIECTNERAEFYISMGVAVDDQKNFIPPHKKGRKRKAAQSEDDAPQEY